MEKTVYVITYTPFGLQKTSATVVHILTFCTRKDANAEAKQLRACGHRHVTIVKTELR